MCHGDPLQIAVVHVESVQAFREVVPQGCRILYFDGVAAQVLHAVDRRVEGVLSEVGQTVVCGRSVWLGVAHRVQFIGPRRWLFPLFQDWVTLNRTLWVSDPQFYHPLNVVRHDVLVLDAVLERVPAQITYTSYLKVRAQVPLRLHHTRQEVTLRLAHK